MTKLTIYIIPMLIFGILSYSYFKKKSVYDDFVEGAKEGLTTVFKILPNLVALFVAVGLFKELGAQRLATFLFRPFFIILGIPEELISLLIVRQISGTASIAIITDIFNNFGPDTYIGRAASVIMGSTETIFYVITLYLGTNGISKIKYSLLCVMFIELTAAIASCYLCNYF